MKKIIFSILFLSIYCFAGKSYSVDTLRIFEDTSCLYIEKTCDRVVNSDSKISENLVVIGTMTIRWHFNSPIGQDYYTAHQIAMKEGGKQGANKLMFISVTTYTGTGNIGDITYRMYSKPCE